MTKAEANAKRMAAAHTPEARAKRAATMMRKKLEQEALGDETPRAHSIPLSAIPDDRPARKKKKYVKVLKTQHNTMTREVAALEIVRLTMWLADPRNA